MALEQLRNVLTGEVTEVETTSDEYLELINEMYDHDGSARPLYEITGQHHTRRMDAGDVADTDLGEQFTPVAPTAAIRPEDVGPDPHPEQALTVAEREAGIESWDQKAKELDHFVPTVDVAPLNRVEPEKRREQGQKSAGSTRGRKSSRKSTASTSGSSSSGSSSGSSGSSGSQSGSSGGASA